MAVAQVFPWDLIHIKLNNIYIQEHAFSFDHCYGINATQQKIYEDLGVNLLEKALAGYNGK